MRPGRLRAIPSRTPMRNWKIESTIEGVYSTKASRTPAISLSAPSAMAGTHSTSTSTKVSTTALIASPIAGALSAITLQNSTIASPILATMAGISSAIPVMITVRDATIAVAPAVPAAANAVTPTAKADRPAPARAKPAPIPTTDTPISANAPLKPRIVGTRGVRTRPATPITVNAPARATSPLAIAVQLIAPRMLSTGVMTSNALAATNIAADPASVPVIAFKPIARIAIAPPRVTKPLAISSQVIPLILLRASAITTKAAATAIRPVPIPTIFLGMKLTAIVTAVSAPAIATSPLAISSQDIEPKSCTAEANIFIEAAIAIKATPVDITCLAFPVRFVKSVISASNAPTETNPFAISSHSMPPKSSQAEANTLIAAANITIPVAVVMDLPLNFAVFINRETSASRTPTPTNPLASSSQLSAERSSQTDASTLIAAANITICVAPFTIVPLPLLITFAAATITVVKPATPITPVVSCFASKSPIFFKALARIRTDVAMPSIAVTLLVTPLA